MRSTRPKRYIELDGQKVELAFRLGKALTLMELLDQALDICIAQARRHSMANLLGTGFWDVNRTSPRKGSKGSGTFND